MKAIQPIQVWNEGKVQTATIFSLSCNSDNLSTTGQFQYQLLTNELTAINTGFLTMNGVDYDNWDSNEYAYEWAASQLNIILIGDWTTTTTTTSTTTQAPTTTTTTTTTTTKSPIYPSTTSTTSSTTTIEQ
jgi:hypothetical protein